MSLPAKLPRFLISTSITDLIGLLNGWDFPVSSPQTDYRGIDDRQLSSEKKALQAHPDFIWQKAIWEKLSQTAVWNGRETLRLYANPESLEIKFANEPETLHFFEPSGISPLMLPIIKLLSEHGHKVYVYLLNPCVEYWFDSLFGSRF